MDDLFAEAFKTGGRKTVFFVSIGARQPYKHLLSLVDVSDIFYLFFCSGAGEREEASEEVAGGAVNRK